MAMLFPDRNLLLGDLPIIVPVGGIAVWAWEWQTLAVILFATIVVWLLFGAAREERPCLQKRVLALVAKSGLMFIAAAGLVVCWAVALTIAAVLGVPPVP